MLREVLVAAFISPLQSLFSANCSFSVHTLSLVLRSYPLTVSSSCYPPVIQNAEEPGLKVTRTDTQKA